MLDIPALPIAFALTLWDALPLFLSVSVALALIARSTLRNQSFHRTWSLRDTSGIEGLLYAAMFYPDVVPLVAIAAIVASTLQARRGWTTSPGPATPARALRARAEEVVVHVLLGSAVAAIIKVAASDIPATLWLELCVAAIAGALVGFRAGAVAIPAVAIAVHTGGIVPATACVAASVAISTIPPVRRLRQLAQG